MRFLLLKRSEGIDYLNLNIPDAILSDYEMPEMNGIEFRKCLLNHSDFKDIPFVFRPILLTHCGL